MRAELESRKKFVYLRNVIEKLSKNLTEMRHLFLILCAAFAVSVVSAQPPMGHPQGGDSGKRQNPSKRIERIKESLQLTDEQAEKFAPVYLAYQREISGIRKGLKQYMSSYEGQEIDEKVAFRLVMAQLNADADVIACKKEYTRVFKDYLTPEQLSKIFLVEKQRPQRPPQQGGAPGGDAPQGAPQR